MKIVIPDINQTSPSLFWSILLFYIPLLIPVFLIVSVSVYPSLDGAAHVYNSHIIKELLFNPSTSYSNYFEFNKVIVPNWLDHILLAILQLIFSPAWSLKILLIILAVSQAMLFRGIILKLKPENYLLSCLVLPFVFGSFFYVGLYNQQLSLVILYAFIYWLLNSGSFYKQGLSFYFGLFLFSLLFWFSSIVTYAIVLIIVGLIHLLKSYQDKIKPFDFLKKTGALFLVLLPTLLLSLNFISKIEMAGNEKPIALLDKLILFFSLEPLIVFDAMGESRFTIALAILIFFLSILSLKSGSLNNLVIKALKIGSVLLIAALFIIPNEASAGMLTYRFAMLFYIVVIILLVSMNFNSKYVLVTSIVIVGIHLGLIFKRHNGRVINYVAISQNFIELGKHVPKGATIWPVSVSDNWFVGHSSNLSGPPNSAINYENYETSYPWFPLRFKAGKESANALYHQLQIKGELNLFTNIPADYLIISGLNEGNSRDYKPFIDRLDSPLMVYQTPDSTMKLYKLQKKSGQ